MTRTALVSALPFAFLLSVSIAGVDFGQYWDDDATFSKVRRSLTPPPTLLPYAYDYPGVTFLMALTVLTPEALRDPGLRRANPDTSALEAFTHTDRYRLRTRMLFAAASSLAVVWVAGLCLAIEGTLWEAFLAASFLAASWEVGYHVRWIAPDGVTTMFVAAAVMCAAFSLRASPFARPRWISSAAVMAGLATASKYSAWPVVLTVLAAGWLSDESGSTARARVRRLGGVAATSVGAFFVMSPGTLLQPTLAFGQMRAQIFHYANGHGIYTVGRGVDHLRRMLLYDTLVLPSPYIVVAVAFSGAALVGLVALTRQSPRVALVVLGFPVFFTLYFALQKAMIVRNLLVVAPFGAVLAARGVRAAWQASSGTGRLVARTAIAGSVALGLALNVSYQVSAARSISARAAGVPYDSVDEFRAWRLAQPGVSAETLGRLAQIVPAAGSGTSADVALFALDAVDAGARPNEPRTFRRVFGLREVNLNYYPDWIGAEHIVVMSRVEAAQSGILDH